MRPTLEAIEATVERLETRLSKSSKATIRLLLAGYARADARFRADLTDPRDLALSRGAALMLIKILDDAEAGD